MRHNKSAPIWHSDALAGTDCSTGANEDMLSVNVPVGSMMSSE